MAKVFFRLDLESNDADEVIDILTRLKGVKLEPKSNYKSYSSERWGDTIVITKDETSEEPEDEPVPQTEAPKTTRRRKATETAGAPAAEQQPDMSASAGPASDASPATTSSTTGAASPLVGDTLSQQIKTANAEAKAERDTEVVTLEVVQQALAEATKPGGGMSMMKAQEVLMANFTTTAGEPLRRIREAKPEDYAAILAKFKA